MAETYTERLGRQCARTNLTPGEKRALHKLQLLLLCASEADVIRQVLRERLKSEGLLG